MKVSLTMNDGLAGDERIVRRRRAKGARAVDDGLLTMSDGLIQL
jgi:hypothetical protein